MIDPVILRGDPHVRHGRTADVEVWFLYPELRGHVTLSITETGQRGGTTRAGITLDDRARRSLITALGGTP